MVSGCKPNLHWVYMQCCYCCVAAWVGVGAADLRNVQGHQAPRACHPAADLSKFSSAFICDVRSFAASDAGRCVRNACSSCSSSPWQATRTKTGLKRVSGSEEASTSHFLCPSLLSSIKTPRSTGTHKAACTFHALPFAGREVRPALLMTAACGPGRMNCLLNLQPSANHV